MNPITKLTLITVVALLLARPTVATDVECFAVSDSGLGLAPLDNPDSCYVPHKWWELRGETKWQGIWELRWWDGWVHTGPYVDGKKHGRWELRRGGEVHTGQYAGDKPHGQWEERYASGTVLTKNYINGMRHGWWEEIILRDGSKRTGHYVDGKKHGRWTKQLLDGTVITENYVNGVLQE